MTMKKLFFSAVIALLFSEISIAQNADPLMADTIIYIENGDGSFDILAAQVFRGVTNANKRNFERERVKRQLNNLAQLENQVRDQKKKIQADSAALAKEIQGTDPNDLYREDVEELAGVWKLTISEATDEITIDSTGRFTSKKSGDGTVTVLAEGAKKIEIEIVGKKIPLAREADELFLNEKLTIKLKRKKEEETTKPNKK